MAVEFQVPKVPTPLRAVLLGAATQGWFNASDEERRQQVLPRFKQMIQEWSDMGAKVLATVDDDLFMVGEPGAPDFTWYLIFEVPSIDVLAAMIHRVRTTVDGVRLDRYIRIEGRLGRPFFLLEGGH
ncbi:hypothetical protein [uncultured Alsobacter sp.]|jgi:hypothetical protein|uniref:hypothetical protein n=1 Tax=uncultured Alsobacter sp. TaxID=1748258 RepID=UPI0025E5C583|nr:hypothetical protein [uncultured Alsobacter sp.]